MKVKRSLTLTLILALLLTVFGNNYNVNASTNVLIDPDVQYQTITGWGTSLAWWGNAIGLWSDTTKKNEIMDLIFDENTGLGLNIARYNIGGGENPSHEHMRDKAEIDGYQPSEGVWDWTADSSQRWILDQAIARGVDTIEAFSNAPPYWMTYSQCAAGSTFGNNNLKDNYYDDFAEYITEVIKHFKDNWGITFDTVAPLNEPISTWWKSSNNQEGCHFDRDKQNLLINLVGEKLTLKGLDTTISVPEEYNINDTITSYNAFDSSGKSYITQINTHTYKGDNRVGLLGTALAEGKKLWVSEVGAGGSASHDHNDMTSVIDLSNQITKDLKELQPDAWVYWQVVEDEAGDHNWGLIHANFSGIEDYWVTKQYYGMANYSKFIRPGYKIIDVNNTNILATLDNNTNKLVCVVTNGGSSDATYNIDLSKFNSIGSTATPYRTSQNENLAQLSDITVVNNHLEVTAKANSVTTYVINNATYTNGTQFERDSYYKIVNKNSGKALDVSGASTANGADVIQWDYLGGDNQQWRIVEVTKGRYYILNKNSGKMLDVNGQSIFNGADIIQWECNGGDNQLWQLIDVGSGYYKIVSVKSGKALDVLDESTSNGGDIIQWSYWGGDNQQWTIEKIQ